MLHDTRTRMAGLIRINAVVLLREPGPLVSRLVMPVILMVILRPLYTAALPHGGTAQAVTGMSVMFSLLALGLVGSGILNERIWHTWDRLRTSATTPVEILVAKSVPSLVFLAAQQLVVFTVGAVALGLPVAHPGLLILATGTWVAMLLGLGMALGTLSRSHAELAAAQDVGGLVLTSLGGALVPLAVLPGWVHHIAPLTPGYWGVQAMTAALSGDGSRVLEACAIVAGVTLTALGVACWRIRRGWTRSDLL